MTPTTPTTPTPSDSTSSTTDDEGDALPPGTSPEYARMHTWIRRVCYVLLFVLVIEGALTFPLLAIWYGFPELTPQEVCSELQKEMYADDTRECETPYRVFPGPPIGSPSEAQGQTTAVDDWGIQPVPGNERIDFRQLVDNYNARQAQEEAEGASSATTTTTTDG